MQNREHSLASHIPSGFIFHSIKDAVGKYTASDCYILNLLTHR